MNQEEKRFRLLVVEDDDENQSFLRVFFSKKFDVEVCDSSETFYQKMEEHKPEVIIMDISLRGDKDGLELTRELRADEKTRDVIIVGLSAHAFQRDRENALKAGVDIFLTKPVPNDTLYQTVKNLIMEKYGIDIGDWRKKK
jgi:two-component system sensor histidine kinase BarA